MLAYRNFGNLSDKVDEDIDYMMKRRFETGVVFSSRKVKLR